jgi:hypothetical protein
VKLDAERLGIRFDGDGVAPGVFYAGDGESKDFPPPPGWRALVNAQATRLGSVPRYREEQPA